MDAARNEYSSDPAIIAAYNAVVRREINWMLLHYDVDNYEQLMIYATGCDGLEELKTHMYDPSRVFVAFYCDDETYGRPRYLLVNYIPPTISGVKRARASVHSRRLGMVLKKHETALTVDDISKLTSATLYRALVDPDSLASSSNLPPPPHRQPSPTPTSNSNTAAYGHYSNPQPHHTAAAMGHSFSLQEPSQRYHEQYASTSTSTSSNGKSKLKKPKPITLNAVRKSFSEMYAPHAVPSPRRHFQDSSVPTLPPKSQAQLEQQQRSGGFVNLLRRMREVDMREDMVGMDIPPPRPPPKDVNSKSMRRRSPSRRDEPLPPPPPPNKFSMDSAYTGSKYSTDTYTNRISFTESVEDFTVIEHGDLVEKCDYERKDSPPPPGAANTRMDDRWTPSPPHHQPDAASGSTHVKLSPTPLTGKWAPRGALPIDPREREKLRRERMIQRELEERAAREEETRLQEEHRKRKEAARLQEEEEERQRQVRLKLELQRISEDKERRRKWEAEEEVRKAKEMEERRRAEREKRLEESRRAEEWRKEQERLKEEEIRQKERERQVEEETRRRKIQLAEAFIKHNEKAESLLCGWVNIQFTDSPFWKRRYFKVVDTVLFLYRSPKDMTTPMEIVELAGQVQALKEWSDGYEELKAIPNSFVVEFKDQRVWSAYTDSEPDKFRVLGLLKNRSSL